MINQKSKDSCAILVLIKKNPQNTNKEASGHFFFSVAEKYTFVLIPYNKEQENSWVSGNITVQLKGRCQA